MKVIQLLNRISHSRWYWQFYILAALALLAAALFFQHALDQGPCVTCIQVRVWLVILVMVSVFGLFTRHKIVLNTLAHVFVISIAGVLLERSYLLLGTERGFIFSDCGFDLGLPPWLALEEWLPWLFRVETSCGYTPEIIFGITMAEVLIVLSVLLLVSSILVLVASFLPARTAAGSEP